MSASVARTEDMAIDLGVIWAALWRAKIWLVPLLLAVGAAAFVGLSTIPPRFKAESKVLIEARSIRLDNNQRDADAERTLLDQEGVASQVQLISSRDLGRRVVVSQKLDRVEEFLKTPGFLARLLPKGRSISPEEQVLEAYFERLNVYQIERSRVITIEFTARDPDLAARVANAVAREYLEVQAEAKVNLTSDTTKWLDREIVGLRGKVAEAEAKVEQWRASHDLFATNRDGTLVEQQLGGLNQQLTTLKTDKAAAEARAAGLRRSLEQGGALDGSTELQNSTAYQRLRERESTLRGQAAELATTLLPNHPRLKAIAAQIADVQAEQRAEARRILSALDNDVKVADQKMRDLRNDLGDGKAQAAKANENDIQLRALEREAKAQRDLLETFLARFREAASRQNETAQPPDARQISEASPPSSPFFPKVVPLTFLLMVATLIIVSALIILRELLSGRALRPLVPAPVAPVASETAAAPATDREPPPSDGDPDPAPPPPTPPAPPPARRRSLPRDILARLKGEDRAGTITIAAAAGIPAASAHDVALALVREAATGARACLVVLHSGAVLPAGGPGLSEVFSGTASFGDAIAADPQSRAHLVGFGAAPLDEAAVGAPRFGMILDALAASYDHLVLDVGPLDAARPALAGRLARFDARLLVAGDDVAAVDIARAEAALGATAGEDVILVAPAPDAVGGDTGRSAA